MNKDQLRERLTFYRDLGVTDIYKREPTEGQMPDVGQAPGLRPDPSPPLEASRMPLPPLTPPGETLLQIQNDIGPDCRLCRLCEQRSKIVFGSGNETARLVFVGEGPGADEDAQGFPFVGRAGQLLTQMIENTAAKEGIPIKRPDVYICNVVKCRPPENRLPEKDEIATCSPYLFRQLGVISPKVICALGSCSAQTLLQTTQGISRFRGEWFDLHGAKFIATYHPAYLLRNPPAKSDVWKDLQKIMAYLGLELPKKK